LIQTKSHIKEFIRHLLSAIANASLYSMDHPQVVRLTSQAFESLCSSFESQPEFTIMVIENELVIDGKAQEFSQFFNRFAQILSSRGISHLRLIQGLSRPEINAFISDISNNTSITKQNIKSSDHLKLGWVELRKSEDINISESERILLETRDNDSQDSLNKTSLSEIPRVELDRFREIYETVKKHHKLKINGIIEIVTSFIDVYQQEGNALLVMAALRKADEYTFTHSTNVSVLNIAQASFLGIKGQLLNDIGVAGLLHDIGKLFVPEEIVSKTGSLTQNEVEIMRSHPVKGARYLLETPGVPRLAVINAFEHHIKHDLSGYPDVPESWQLNICSQITAISDIFDALRTRRSYREPLELNTIIEIMQGISGTELHPALTRNFLNVISSLKTD
jgi:HD-GYP domain-containing protein (c-di-GMP phosphodiesterase class II)